VGGGVRHASAGVVWVIGRTQLQSRGGRELQATAPRWEHVRSTTTASDAVMASSMAVLHLAAEPRSHMAVTLHAGTVPRYPARCLRASPEHPTPTLRGEHAISLISWQAQPRCQPSSKQRIASVLFFFRIWAAPFTRTSAAHDSPPAPARPPARRRRRRLHIQIVVRGRLALARARPRRALRPNTTTALAWPSPELCHAP
jgi:hypothetical protein